jgi:serine/threonine protein phosphatase PrpC
MSLAVEAAIRTHVGLVRRRNEDSSYAGQWLLAVADGMGGHVSGDIASAVVIEAIRPYDRYFEPSDLSTALGQAVNVANEALRREIEAASGLAGMGTTLVALLWAQTTAVIANVGDSRAYLIRDGGLHEKSLSRLTQITEDHTYGNLVADAASVPHLPERISRFLDGRADGRSPDLTIRDLRAGDRFLLCSDGLSSVVPHELISSVVASPGAVEEAADRLIGLAVDHGGPDNITVIIMDVA